MRVRVPRKHTVVVDLDGRDNYAAMMKPDLLLVANDLGLAVSVGQPMSYDLLPDGRTDLTQHIYDDVWVEGPDEEVVFFKLKYL